MKKAGKRTGCTGQILKNVCVKKIKFRDFPGVPAVNASQVAPVVKNPPANAREVRDVGSTGVHMYAHTYTHTLTLVVQQLRLAQMVKHLPPMQETWVQSLVQEDPLEKEMATHTSMLAWRILWTEGPQATVLEVAKSWI